jgi:hypothetical protein
MNGGMIDEHAALLHHLFQIPQTQGVSDVPSHAQQHDVQGKALPLNHTAEPLHDRLAFATAGNQPPRRHEGAAALMCFA